MSTTPIPLSERLGIPSEQWKRLIYQTLCDFRVACPGIIKDFDSEHQTVTVQLALREKIVQNFKVIDTELPLLVHVPILFPRAGGFSLTFPVQEGDECLVIFGDMCIDAWWQNGDVQNQLEKRRHDLNDGFALFAPWNQTRLLQNYSVSSAQLRSDDGTVKIDIDSSQVTVTAQKVVVTASSEVDISGNGVTKIEGVDFLTHQHTGVATGGGVSGPVKTS